MNSWVNRRSFPIVTVERINATSFRLRQESFLAAKSAIQNQTQDTGNSTQVGLPLKNTTKSASVSGHNSTTSFNGNNTTFTVGNLAQSFSNNNTKQPAKRSEDKGEEKDHEKKKNKTTDDTLWSIPFTYVTNIDAVETLVWFDQKGMYYLYSFFFFLPLFRSFLCLLYTSPSPRDATLSRMPSSA